jgi:hypothetical protein
MLHKQISFRFGELKNLTLPPESWVCRQNAKNYRAAQETVATYSFHLKNLPQDLEIFQEHTVADYVNFLVEQFVQTDTPDGDPAITAEIKKFNFDFSTQLSVFTMIRDISLALAKQNISPLIVAYIAPTALEIRSDGDIANYILLCELYCLLPYLALPYSQPVEELFKLYGNDFNTLLRALNESVHSASPL